MQLFFLQRSQHAKFGLMSLNLRLAHQCLVIASYLQDQQVCTVETSQNPAFLQFISMNLPVNYRKNGRGTCPDFGRTINGNFSILFLLYTQFRRFFGPIGFSVDFLWIMDSLLTRYKPEGHSVSTILVPPQRVISQNLDDYSTVQRYREGMYYSVRIIEKWQQHHEDWADPYTTRSGTFIAETVWYDLKACTK